MEPSHVRAGPTGILRLVVITAVTAAAASLAPGMTNSARAQTSVGGVCGWSGRDTITPGLTITPREIVFSFTGTVGPCHLPDGSTQQGNDAGSGRATASCSGGNGSYVETITWNNGKRSTLTATFVFADGVATATAKVTDGEFAGMQVRDVEFVTPDDAAACASAGVTGASYDGVLAFGGP